MKRPLQKGDRVRMSKFARDNGFDNRSDTGVVVGLGRNPVFVWVLRDGTKTPNRYHIDYWRKDSRAAQETLPSAQHETLTTAQGWKR